MKPYLLILILIVGSHSAQTQSFKSGEMNFGKHSVDGWQGTLTIFSEKKVTPVFIQYQKYDSIPNPFHKELIVGKIENRSTGISYPLVGYLQDQGEDAIRFFRIGKNGAIEQIFYAHIVKDQKMKGSLFSTGEQDSIGVFTLYKKDTLFPSNPIKPHPDKIFGTYRYDFPNEGPEGYLSIHKDKNGEVNFKIYSREKDGGGHVEVHQDSIRISGSSFTFDAKAYGVTIWSAKVVFYKNLAVVGFIKPTADAKKFGKRATIEGVFIKEKK